MTGGNVSEGAAHESFATPGVPLSPPASAVREFMLAPSMSGNVAPYS
jgi:hypothetical protein